MANFRGNRISGTRCGKRLGNIKSFEVAGGLDVVVDAVGAVGFQHGDVHGLPQIFIGSEDEAGFVRDIRDCLIGALGGAEGF